MSIQQAHLVWLFSIINICIGFLIGGFDPFAQSISEVALEKPIFAYTHRFANIVIGTSMCVFGIALQAIGRKKFSFAMLSICLLGLSMFSAGVWTLESPLHLLYNLSIFMIVVPIAFALEFKEEIDRPAFETFCLTTSFIHVFVFWCIYAGFIPREYNGLVQRIWAVATMGWFGVAAYSLSNALSTNDSSKADTLTSGA